MRKKLTLSVATDTKPYGIDESNIAVLLPNDFRKTVVSKIESGEFKNGDVFEVDVDKNGDPIRRSFDETVAIHRPVEKRFSKDDLVAIVEVAIRKTKNKEEFDIEDLIA